MSLKTENFVSCCYRSML